MQDEKGMIPLGSSLNPHIVGHTFNSPDTSYVTVHYIEDSPGGAGMPLINEQGANFNNVIPSGHWLITSPVSLPDSDIAFQIRRMTANFSDTIMLHDSLRIIRRDTNSVFSLSGSPNMEPPVSLDSAVITQVQANGIFGVGWDCNLVVTNATDGAAGSLRYILDHCAQPGDTIQFAKNLEVIGLTIDTLILNKEISLVNSRETSLTIGTTLLSGVFKIPTGVHIYFENFEIRGGTGSDGNAILNEGSLHIKNMTIRNGISGEVAIINLGEILVEGENRLFQD